MDESFELTKCRISSLVHEDLGKLVYVLYRGNKYTPRFVQLGDVDCLAELGAVESDAILYLMVQAEELYRLAQRECMQQSLKIYN
jgi:hypothetical protein